MSAESSEQEKRRDIKAILSVVPPFDTLSKRKELATQERRIRLRYNETVKPGSLHLNPGLAKELSITEYVEVSVHGRRVKLKVVLDERVPINEVWSSSELKGWGIADNSVVTIRAPRE